VLGFVEGDVAVPPFPASAAADDLLVSVADLQRRYHEAAMTFVAAADDSWHGDPVPSAFSGALVCHNDLCLENVVVRRGRAVAFIDFDHARPADRLWDIAIAMRHWVPMRHPSDLDDARAHVDVPTRFRTFAAAHGLDAGAQARVLDALVAFLDHALISVRAQAEAGHAGHRAQWEEAGYETANRRARGWVVEQRRTLLAS
jgi:Ser/Thr protein kinase RdoA (MazF antagonist)